ncbi:hypothetical protein JQ559_09190 [Bradyrhizobium viridifuturi]|nr:hypothetical protein [Bradyrhizobium viridifuturi]
MRDNVNRIEAFDPHQRFRHLPCSRPCTVEHNSPNLGPEILQQRVQVGNERIDEQKL